MVERRVDRSRRKVIRAVVKGVSAGLLLRISKTEAAEKMTPQQAEYRDTPNGIYSCAVCTLFEAPQSCKVVAGEVSKDGWCARPSRSRIKPGGLIATPGLCDCSRLTRRSMLASRKRDPHGGIHEAA
jgi:hypothetical protein